MASSSSRPYRFICPPWGSLEPAGERTAGRPEGRETPHSPTPLRRGQKADAEVRLNSSFLLFNQPCPIHQKVDAEGKA